MPHSFFLAFLPGVDYGAGMLFPSTLVHSGVPADLHGPARRTQTPAGEPHAFGTFSEGRVEADAGWCISSANVATCYLSVQHPEERSMQFVGRKPCAPPLRL